jgi:SAM-dependent methyltransferase
MRRQIRLLMLRDYLSNALCTELFGDRQRYGRDIWANDPDWQRWLDSFTHAYQDSHTGIQGWVNRSGYQVLLDYKLDDHSVLELGPGGGYHIDALCGRPRNYLAIDITDDLADGLRGRFEKLGLSFQFAKVEPNSPRVDLPDASLDTILTFYSLEHVHPLSQWLDELFRLLKPGGRMVGAIPTEGGLAWGLGRYLTSMRSFKKNYDLDLRKIICWSHPNMVDEILAGLSQRGRFLHQSRWPLPFLPNDFNLVNRFVVEKKA